MRFQRQTNVVTSRAFAIGACVVGLLCASACSSGAGKHAAATNTVGATTLVTATVASATATRLAAGHWSTIPAAPLSNRLFASVAWTGKELIVWGGNDSPSGQPHNDGAAYNPTTREWRKLPPSPLTRRGGAAAVWTGSEVVFWGGVVPAPAGRVTSGSVATAAYRPDTNSWRTIAPAPLPPTTFPIGFWTGDRVLLFSGLDAASYDPSTNKWQRLPSPVLPLHRPGWKVRRGGWELAVSAGPGRILAWSGWGAQKQIAPNSTEASAGSDLFRYDESTNRWTALGPTAAAISGPGEAFWTGSRVLFIGSAARAPLSQGPPEPLMTASYDPETGKATAVPAGALVANGLQVWTGGALWSDRGAGDGPGDTATAFDPSRGTSRRLTGAPFTSNFPAVPIWTGTSVLIYASAQIEPMQPHPVGGLEYVVR